MELKDILEPTKCPTCAGHGDISIFADDVCYPDLEVPSRCIDCDGTGWDFTLIEALQCIIREIEATKQES